MIYGLWQSAAGLQAQEYRQAIIANNLANAETPGFKADRIAFQERLNASMTKGTQATRHPVLDAMTGGLFETEVYTDFRFDSNSLLPSNSPLDVAIHGDGFLAVQTPEGPRYTRDGRFLVNTNGTLVHAVSGRPILDLQERPITLDPTSSEPVKIDALGNVKQGDTVAGRLALVDFADRQQLEKTGENLFSAEGAQQIEASGRVRQFYYEASGVDPIQTLVEMIAANRAYEINARMITMQDDTLGKVINDVGRI